MFQLLNELHPGLDFSFFSGGENNYDCKVNPLLYESLLKSKHHISLPHNHYLLFWTQRCEQSVLQVTVEELTFASKGRKNKKEAKKGVAMEALSTLYNVVYPPGSQFAS